MKLEKFSQPTEITVFANVTGRLWWPQDRVEFETHKTFYRKVKNPFQAEFYDLRHALLDLQSSGDFQGLDFVGPVEIVLERQTDFVDSQTRRIVKSITRRKVVYVEPEHPEYKDLFVH